MRVATFLLLLAVCGAVLHAQTTATPSGDVTIKISEGTPEYCLGPHPSILLQGSLGGPNDILLRLPLRLQYANHRSETIFLPRGYSFLWRMAVTNQTGSTTLRNGGGGAHGLDIKSLMALSHPEGGPFWIVPGGKDTSPAVPNLSVLKYKGAVDDDDSVLIPVLDGSVGWDLRGKTVQIVTTRDFRSSIAPEVVAKLNEKWKAYGIIWAQVVESDTLTIQIPQVPLTRNCMPKPLPR
jgi:hypothetical protein